VADDKCCPRILIITRAVLYLQRASRTQPPSNHQGYVKVAIVNQLPAMYMPL
jgi:hypothetical protein